MDVHLDWHFNHKRRIREGAARAQGRSWLSLEEVSYTSANEGESKLMIERNRTGSNPMISILPSMPIRPSEDLINQI